MDIRLVDYPGSRDVEIEVNSYRVLPKYLMIPRDLQQVKRRRGARLPSIVTWGLMTTGNPQQELLLSNQDQTRMVLLCAQP